ncbi:MAG TPA: hypothetical protein GX708_14855 [Gallicola sp.]|nr:hypothetical protein [Gallicola sp.]
MRYCNVCFSKLDEDGWCDECLEYRKEDNEEEPSEDIDYNYDSNDYYDYDSNDYYDYDETDGYDDEWGYYNIHGEMPPPGWGKKKKNDDDLW